jgi:hypothetical protein
MGFVALSRLLQEMEALGLVRDDIRDAANFCLAKELIEVDTGSLNAIRERDSIKATASGWAHLRLLSSRLEYIASVLPTTPLDDRALSARVFDLMQTENRTGKLPFYQAVRIVEGFESYLRSQIQELAAHPGFGSRPQSGSAYVLGKIGDALTYARRENDKTTGQADLLDL